MSTVAIPLDLEQYLGPAHTRFFAEGYKASSHEIVDTKIDREARRLTGRVSVTYGHGWSRKRGVDQAPHLSTVDIMVLNAVTAQRLLRSCEIMTESELAAAWISKVVVIAGDQPVEDLVELPLQSSVTKAKTVDGQSEVVVRTQVGAMTARLTLRADPSGRRGLQPGTGATSSAESGYWDARFRGDRHRLGPVDLDISAGAARTTVWLDHHSFARGLEASYSPFCTVLDAFVILMQLGQVLLYETDGIARGDSDTLWMQNVTLKRDSAPRQMLEWDTADMSLEETQRITLASGTWSNAVFHGQLSGVTMDATFAHRVAPPAHGEST